MKICVDPGHGGKDPGAIGFDPFYVEEKTVNLSIALRLEAELESRGHWTVMTRRKDRSRGIKEANLAVLRLTEMPAILVETEFLTNPAQLLFLTDPVHQDEIAAAIGAGVDRLSKLTV